MRELKPLPTEINGVKVIRDLGMNNQIPKKRIAEFECYCGKVFVGKINSVLVGHKRSCGCLINKPSVFTHLLSKHPLYRKWSGMITRVTNQKESHWHRYGGRGITICNEWRNDFMAFYNWAIANGYEKGLTIDRINNDGNYEPSNCQWITMEENTMKDKKMFLPTKQQLNAICDMYINSHVTVTYLAKIFSTHKQRISEILKSNDIELKHRRMKKCLIK